ncbi:hypothetical protein [Streptomyces sparsogenes]|uniref:Uncharacterized protein n=1 Tax=Streptomyces sparsogenes DSM 40356 TaxID=1331668 RepID=A0A1R1SB52_9ACTN|nr:hypothetical protein [Streptomyces sparsogenes]OMI35564.1 hypothetical protein SPAR_30666 [Streptomyces sparsogenes DSM 40356]
MTGQELADVRGALIRLRDCVEFLRLADSEAPHVRGLVQDADRLRLGLDAMAGSGVAALARGTARGSPATSPSTSRAATWRGTTRTTAAGSGAPGATSRAVRTEEADRAAQPSP